MKLLALSGVRKELQGDGGRWETYGRTKTKTSLMVINLILSPLYCNRGHYQRKAIG
jgi:hypothetical protein